MTFDVIIIGAGAAGSYCALHAAMRGLSVALLEKNATIGAKIRVSGGGRCNHTNLYIQPEAYLSQNPHFCRSALARYTQWDFLAWYEAQHLSYHEKTLGQLFCDQKSRGLISALENALYQHQVQVFTDNSVTAISKNPSSYTAQTTHGEYEARQLVIATGGPSFPKLGATDSALSFAKQLNIGNIPFRPALVPLTLQPAYPHLAGIGTEVIAHTAQSPRFRENLLFTHRGLSGPAILQISSYREKEQPIVLDFLPDEHPDFLHHAKAQNPNQTLFHILKTRLASKLAEQLAAPYPEPLQHYHKAEIAQISARIKAATYDIAGTEGMAKAEVSTGGIDTRELDPRTLMVKKHPNLFAIGEAVDVTGWLGGYNFQWAWSSAWCCAQALKSARDA